MNTTRNRAAVRAAAALALLALGSLFVACEEGPVGIFASVAGETPVNANMTKAFEFASPSWIAQDGTDYYVGIGVLWKRTVGGAWSRVDVSAVNAGTTFAVSGAVANSNIYAVFADTASGNKLGVWESADGAAWARTDAAFPVTGEQLISVLAANDQLFAITRVSTTVDGVTTETHSLYYLNGAAFSPTAIVAADIGTPDSVAYDGTDYWFTAGKSILRGPLGSIALVDPAAPVTGQPSAEIYGGVTRIGATADLIVSSRSGKLWLVSGGVWTASPVFSNSKEKAYAFSQPAYVTYGAASAVLAGAQAYPRSSTDLAPAGGYLEFAAPFVPATATPAVNPRLITDAINFDTSLAYESVRCVSVFPEGAGSRVFALADGHGLWSNYYDGASWSKWSRE